MEKLATGDRSVDVPSVGRKDEVGSTAATVLTFKQAAVEQARLEREASASRLAQDAQCDRQSSIDNSKADDFKVFVRAVQAGLNGLSSGDLIPAALTFRPVEGQGVTAA